MHCCVPFCRSTTDNAGGTDEVTFHGFPLDAALHTKWLWALGIHDQPLKDSAVVCSQHFLKEDFCNIEGGSRQVRLGVVPSTIKLCMICLATDRYVASLRIYNLEEAYEQLTGHSICREGYLKQTLCIKCAQHLTNFEKFRSKSLRARSAMMDLVKRHETVTLRHLKQINDIRDLLKSEIVETAFAPDHCDLHIKECSNGEVQTDSGNIVLPDPIHAVKIEPYECSLDENDIGLKLEATNEDNGVLNDERQDTTAFINYMSDASILPDTKLMHEALTTELDLDKAIKLECSVYSDDNYNSCNDDTRQEECGSEECDTRLAHCTHTALHSQYSDTNQVRVDDTTADYPHTAVKLVPIQLLELPREKNNRAKTIKAVSINCIIESEPKASETTNFETLDKVNETELNFEKPFSCKLCNYSSKLKGHLINHMKIHSGEKPFSCTFCEYACRTKGDLVKHIKIHSDEKPFSCKFCEYACREKRHLVTHMRIHTGEKPFSCKFCEHACREKGSLVKHMRIHTGEKPFSCNLCAYTCRRKVSLRSHMSIHTGEKPFLCKLCEYACTRKESLVRHMRIHTGEKPFSCKLCAYVCRTKGDLMRHIKIHSGKKRFSCKLCEYACKTKEDLEKHIRIHSDEKPFSCKLCEYACRRQADLKRHVIIHTSEKPFSCKLCEYACRRKEDLANHMHIHTGEKPFSCKICDYACRRKGSLKIHMRIHTGEKPFSCNSCEYACRRKEHLASHMRTHTGEKPFSCNSCEYACKSKSELVRHITACERARK